MKTTTISAGIARNSLGEILLVEQEAPYDTKHNWMLPGGQVEKNEDIETSLRREFLEETGLMLSSVNFLSYTTQIFNPTKQSIFNVNIFEISLEDGVINPNDPDNEIISAAYLSPSEAIKKLSNNKFSYSKEPPIDAIQNFPNNYKLWEYRWEKSGTVLVNKLR